MRSECEFHIIHTDYIASVLRLYGESESGESLNSESSSEEDEEEDLEEFSSFIQLKKGETVKGSLM